MTAIKQNHVDFCRDTGKQLSSLMAELPYFDDLAVEYIEWLEEQIETLKNKRNGRR